MNINGPAELCGFLAGNGLSSLCPSLINCMDTLSRMCACDPPQAKHARYNQCVQAYIGFAKTARGMAATLVSKVSDGRITFYLNGQVIGAVSR